jgi:hypothetical protein
MVQGRPNRIAARRRRAQSEEIGWAQSEEILHPNASLEDFVQLAVGLAVRLILEEGSSTADETTEANPYAATELAQFREGLRRNSTLDRYL